MAEPCKIFVAAYTETYAIAVFTDNDLVTEEIGHNSPIIGDLMQGQEPPSDGLWMFEGTIRIQRDDGHLEGYEPVGDDVTITGTWRRPTDAEAVAAAAGENPCLEPC